MDSLPSDLIPLIGIYLSLRDLLSFAQTGKRYYRKCRDLSLVAKVSSRKIFRVTEKRFPFFDPRTETLELKTQFIHECTYCGECNSEEFKCYTLCKGCNKEICFRMLSIYYDDPPDNAWALAGKKSEYCISCIAHRRAEIVKYSGRGPHIYISRESRKKYSLDLIKMDWICSDLIEK